MSKAEFPINIESLSPEWLSHVLRADGLLTKNAVTGFSAEQLYGGYTASVFRLKLDFDGQDDNAPASLVIKIHGDSPATRAYFEYQGIYEREVRFYQKLARTRTLPVPVCYAAEFDRDSGDFVLLLEDLSPGRQGDWEQDPIGDIRIALGNLAQLHASFWGDPLLDKYEWIVNTSNLQNPPPYKGLWADKLARVKQRYLDQLSPNVWSICDKWLTHWDDIMRCMSQDTHTLVHTDVHLEQMFFPTAKLPRFVLFDWQNPSKSWAAEDVIHAIVCDLDIEDRREHEAGLINHYFDCLCQQGVTDLSRDRFWFQCRLSLLWIYYMFFTMLSQPDMSKTLQAEIESAGDDLSEWIFAPLEAATEDWKLHEVLDQAIAESRSGKN